MFTDKLFNTSKKYETYQKLISHFVNRIKKECKLKSGYELLGATYGDISQKKSTICVKYLKDLHTLMHLEGDTNEENYLPESKIFELNNNKLESLGKWIRTDRFQKLYRIYEKIEDPCQNKPAFTLTLTKINKDWDEISKKEFKFSRNLKGFIVLLKDGDNAFTYHCTRHIISIIKEIEHVTNMSKIDILDHIYSNTPIQCSTETCKQYTKKLNTFIKYFKLKKNFKNTDALAVQKIKSILSNKSCNIIGSYFGKNNCYTKIRCKDYSDGTLEDINIRHDDYLWEILKSFI